MHRKASCWLPLLLLWEATCTELYVSSSPSPAGTGTQADPLDLQSCVTQLSSLPAGSSCLLLAGDYQPNETVRVQGVHGTLSEPMLIAAAPGATVNATIGRATSAADQG